MIRPLRQRHRRAVIALGFLLPVAFVAGVAARKPVPTSDPLPPALAVQSQLFQAVQWDRADLFSKSPIRVQLLREQPNAGSFDVKFAADRDFAWPDLLVYWITGNKAVSDTLPRNAILLGGFGAEPLPLPDEAVRTAGVLVLYSLADNEIVDVSLPVSISEPPR